MDFKERSEEKTRVGSCAIETELVSKYIKTLFAHKNQWSLEQCIQGAGDRGKWICTTSVTNISIGGASFEDDEEFIDRLEIYGDEQTDREFVSKMYNIRMPHIQHLRIGGMNCFNTQELIEDVNEFFSYSFNHKIKTLYLGSGGDLNLQIFKSGLENLLPLVEKEVYLWTFDMDLRMLKFVIEKCHKVRRLVFCHCNIVDSKDLSGLNRDFNNSPGIKLTNDPWVGFTLNPSLEYRIKELVLFHGTEKTNFEIFDFSNLLTFVDVMSKTRLRKSVRSLMIKKD